MQLVKKVCNSSVTCISHGTTRLSNHQHLVQDIRVERMHCQRTESWLALCVCDENESFLLEFLVPGVNWYSAVWFHVKLCAKCTLHSCYRLYRR
jgi:hypothetical protein